MFYEMSFSSYKSLRAHKVNTIRWHKEIEVTNWSQGNFTTIWSTEFTFTKSPDTVTDYICPPSWQTPSADEQTETWGLSETYTRSDSHWAKCNLCGPKGGQPARSKLWGTDGRRLPSGAEPTSLAVGTRPECPQPEVALPVVWWRWSLLQPCPWSPLQGWAAASSELHQHFSQR